MLLNFKADVYKKVISGEKIYEHRKVFPYKLIKSYLYVNTPIKVIIRIVYINNRTAIEDWKEKYSYDKKTMERIMNYLQHYKYAMEITDFQNTNKISLEQLRIGLPRFVVLQMYYFIDNTPLLNYLEQNIIPYGEIIINDFSHITSEQICKE